MPTGRATLGPRPPQGRRRSALAQPRLGRAPARAAASSPDPVAARTIARSVNAGASRQASRSAPPARPPRGRAARRRPGGLPRGAPGLSLSPEHLRRDIARRRQVAAAARRPPSLANPALGEQHLRQIPLRRCQHRPLAHPLQLPARRAQPAFGSGQVAAQHQHRHLGRVDAGAVQRRPKLGQRRPRLVEQRDRRIQLPAHRPQARQRQQGERGRPTVAGEACERSPGSARSLRRPDVGPLYIEEASHPRRVVEHPLVTRELGLDGRPPPCLLGLGTARPIHARSARRCQSRAIPARSPASSSASSRRAPLRSASRATRSGSTCTRASRRSTCARASIARIAAARRQPDRRRQRRLGLGQLPLLAQHSAQVDQQVGPLAVLGGRSSAARRSRCDAPDRSPASAVRRPAARRRADARWASGSRGSSTRACPSSTR